MDTSTETSPVDDLAAARATTLFTSLNTHVMTTGLSAERQACWLWAHPPDEGRDLLPVLWADLADWCRDVAEHLARLADQEGKGMEADATPRQRVKEWVRQQLAADPTLGAHELAERALEYFADDAEVLALALRQAARPEGSDHDEEVDG